MWLVCIQADGKRVFYACMYESEEMAKYERLALDQCETAPVHPQAYTVPTRRIKNNRSSRHKSGMDLEICPHRIL